MPIILTALERAFATQNSSWSCRISQARYYLDLPQAQCGQPRKRNSSSSQQNVSPITNPRIRINTHNRLRQKYSQSLIVAPHLKKKVHSVVSIFVHGISLFSPFLAHNQCPCEAVVFPEMAAKTSRRPGKQLDRWLLCGRLRSTCNAGQSWRKTTGCFLALFHAVGLCTETYAERNAVSWRLLPFLCRNMSLGSSCCSVWFHIFRRGVAGEPSNEKSCLRFAVLPWSPGLPSQATCFNIHQGLFTPVCVLLRRGWPE